MRKMLTAKIAAHRSDLGASSSCREQYVQARNSTSYIMMTGRGRATGKPSSEEGEGKDKYEKSDEASEEVEDFAALITIGRTRCLRNPQNIRSRRDTGVIRHENELAKKKKRGSCEGKKERENDVDGSLNNAVGVIGYLQDADNNVARAAYNSLRIMCTTRRWGSAKVTLPAGCLLLSQRGPHDAQ
ncbi:hypothetical protein ALC62_05042 [Cyphomyrmex costatus]|uniref:Uncharacterized protein n=1 Tax=Cyphomyrmex costatus TaxID=456900 RepID=A0A195CUB4_9HYME|nr:hypothetical protein ALC62_05042 [Cyphomyrmex costatus]